MLKIFFTFLTIAFYSTGFAQIENPVQWTFSAKKINATTYEVHLTAKLDGEWHLYSQSTPDGGPVPTSISFLKNPLITLNGAVREDGKMEKHFEKLFGVEVKQFSDKVDFVQTVNVKAGVKTALRGSVRFMVCNDESCLPPKAENFSVTLN